MSPSQQRLALATYVRLMRATNSARTNASRSLAASGLTLTQFAVLEALYHLGPMSLSEIAAKVLTTGGNLTMVAGNLERDGSVERQQSLQDKRVQVLRLSLKGKAIMRRIFPLHAAAITDFMSALTQKEQEELGELCRKLGQENEFG
jgi:MarR family 2-MHQ and catechol resistance regulon transcriptional repressor